jgi:zinc and cadmium transporter
VGIFGFFILEKVLRWHHHLSPEKEALLKPVGYLNIFADGLHNFVDGILIASSYLISTKIGLATTVAVILHEIPQEIGDFGVLLYSGFSKTKALLFNFLSATFAIAGAVVALILGDMSSDFSLVMLPVAAGGFIYIAGSDLIPELQHEVTVAKSVGQIAALACGVGVMMLMA